MKNFVFFLSVLVLVSCGRKKQGETSGEAPAETGQPNTLTEQEKSEGWKLLFDGRSVDQWRGDNREEFPDTGWVVRDGAITVLEKSAGGNLVTREMFGDFDLRLEFKMHPRANSGIKYYVLEDEYAEGAALGLEYQILDDETHPDAKLGKEGNRTLASLYDIFPSRETHPKPFGEWNQVRIYSKDNHVEHWLNGEKVLEYERGSEEYRKAISESKFTKFGTFGESEKGRILLQNHGHEVSFRNIKIREL